jgi:hypothetical protein
MTGEAGLGAEDLRRLCTIANSTFEDLAEFPTAHSDFEVLIQALSEAAERLSSVTWDILNPEEFEALATGGRE